MREHLLGYLLGSLDAPEHESVERELEKDPALRACLERLDGRLELLRADREPYTPPDGLAARTCEYVCVCTRQPAVALEGHAVAGGAGVRGAWSLLDFAVMGGICLAAAAFFFPAISHGRSQAQLAACQNNLRELGHALFRYSAANAGDFPYVPTSGRRAVAGIYAPTLFGQGFVNEPNSFLCPSSSLALRMNGEPFRIVSLAELDAAESPQASLWQRTLGGSYGFSLGYTMDGQHYAPRNHGRQHYALMADAPSPTEAGRQSENHGRRGQNVLFESCNVQFLRSCTDPSCDGDNFFVSDRGRVEAGMHPDDAVIGESAATPSFLP